MLFLPATHLSPSVRLLIEITSLWKVVLLEALLVSGSVCFPFVMTVLASRTRDPDIEMVNFEGAMHRFRIGRLSYPKIPQWYLSIKMWFYQPGVSFLSKLY